MNSEIREFFNYQLDSWQLAQNNYNYLEKVEQRSIMFGEFPIRLQWNPGRIKSTAANVDTKSIAERACFLCRENRPDEQIIDEVIVPGYDFLVNPYPIFPIHFTVSYREHIHQDNIDLIVMAKFAIQNPELVVFYNGSKSGASAPDHLHFQAGNKEFLPLTDYVGYDIQRVDSQFFPLVVRRYEDLPMKFLHISISTYDEEEISEVLDKVNKLCPDSSMRNILMFVKKSDLLEVLLFPRKSHRPSCYFETGGRQILVSPGAVDMAGVIILPREEDFDKLTVSQIEEIYSQVGYSDEELKELSNNLNC